MSHENERPSLKEVIDGIVDLLYPLPRGRVAVAVKAAIGVSPKEAL